MEGLAPRSQARPLLILRLEREGHVDARALLAALEAAALNLGVRMVPGTLRELLAGPGAVTGVRLADDSTLSSGTVVLAAGATSGTLADGVLPPGAVLPCSTAPAYPCT